MKHFRSRRPFSFAALCLVAVIVGGASVLLGVCGPFTDVTADAFCPFVLEIYYLGITAGTSPTTFDPSSNVTRLQMAAFLSRTVDGALKRGSRRAAMNQFWTPQNSGVVPLTTVGVGLNDVKFDGEDLWVSVYGTNSVSRVRASDGKLLETWTGAQSAQGVLVAMGRIFVTGNTSPGRLYQIDPSQAAGGVTTVANPGNSSLGITFDGARIWTADNADPGSVSIVTPGSSLPWTVTTVTTGFWRPYAALFDGANVWVTDESAGTLLKLDAGGGILQTVTVGSLPYAPVFDGTNIWVPSWTDPGSVAVVRASSGTVLATLTGNGLLGSYAAAFDGQRVLVTNYDAASVSVWKAADLTALGSFPVGPPAHPYGACSDGMNFWITFWTEGKLARF